MEVWPQITQRAGRNRGFCLVISSSVIDGEDLIMAQCKNLVVGQEARVNDGRSMVEDLDQCIILANDRGIEKIDKPICTA